MMYVKFHFDQYIGSDVVSPVPDAQGGGQLTEQDAAVAPEVVEYHLGPEYGPNMDVYVENDDEVNGVFLEKLPDGTGECILLSLF